MLETQALGPSREAGAQSVQLSFGVTSVPWLTQRARWRESTQKEQQPWRAPKMAANVSHLLTRDQGCCRQELLK